jgi:N-acetylglucosamine malate deacetylase 1
MIEKFKKVLVLAPHTDDGELGAGGTIARLIDSGARVTYCAFSTAEESVPAGQPKDILKTEVRAATRALGVQTSDLMIKNYQVRHLSYHRQEILEDLIDLRSKDSFDLILLPSPKDIHQDHSTIAQEGIRAFKGTTILGYELIWNNLSFDTTCFVKLSEEHVSRKVEALKCYASQQERDYMSRDFVFSLAKARGIQIGAEYAESFEVLRWIMD